VAPLSTYHEVFAARFVGKREISMHHFTNEWFHLQTQTEESEF
jgi:hypothetical protein